MVLVHIPGVAGPLDGRPVGEKVSVVGVGVGGLGDSEAAEEGPGGRVAGDTRLYVDEVGDAVLRESR